MKHGASYRWHRARPLHEAGSCRTCHERRRLLCHQNTDDLLDEKLKNNLGLKFAFRSTDINEIKKTLAFFGVDSEDENNQKRLRDLENGSALSVILRACGSHTVPSYL